MRSADYCTRRYGIKTMLVSGKEKLNYIYNREEMVWLITWTKLFNEIISFSHVHAVVLLYLTLL